MSDLLAEPSGQVLDKPETIPNISSREIVGVVSGLPGDVRIMSANCRIPSNAFREISFCREIGRILSSFSDVVRIMSNFCWKISKIFRVHSVKYFGYYRTVSGR